MDGVEFRLGRNDHLVVEDFLSTAPPGVTGITVDAKYLGMPKAAIDAAQEIGAAVHVEPLTERLVVEGYSTNGLDYASGVIDPTVDLASRGARNEFVEAVVTPQLEVATAITPPHFYVERDDQLDLNLQLAQLARQQFDPPVRPILAAQRSYLDQPGLPELVAHRYLHLGAETLELRISPLGGEQEGPTKIRSILRILEGFRSAGLPITLGSQGTIGEACVALGMASGYSLGVGYRESYDHKGALSRQRPSPKRRGDKRAPRGPMAGVYLPGPAITVPRGVGKVLYDKPAIRTRLLCRIGDCANHIAGPSRDPRGHYLHARATNAARVLAQPEPWRAKLQRDRLVGAIDLRDLVNKHLPAKANRLKTRTLKTLVAEFDERIEVAA